MKLQKNEVTKIADGNRMRNGIKIKQITSGATVYILDFEGEVLEFNINGYPIYEKEEWSRIRQADVTGYNSNIFNPVYAMSDTDDTDVRVDEW